MVSTDFVLESGTSQLAIVQRSNYQLPKKSRVHSGPQSFSILVCSVSRFSEFYPLALNVTRTNGASYSLSHVSAICGRLKAALQRPQMRSPREYAP